MSVKKNLPVVWVTTGLRGHSPIIGSVIRGDVHNNLSRGKERLDKLSRYTK